MKKPAIQIILELLSRLPIRAQYRVGDLLAFFVALIPNRLATNTRKNIRLCLTELEPQQQRALRRSIIRHSCYSLVELASVWCRTTEQTLARVTTTNVCAAFNDSKRGRVVIAPHLGNWELLNLWMAQETSQVSLYKPQANPGIDKFILDSRTRNGAQLVPIDASGLRLLMKALKQGETVIILPDQKPEAGKSRVIAPFFGHAALTSTLAYSLCKRVDCDVFIATLYRDQKLGNFGLEIDSLARDSLITSAQESAEYLNRQIETLVRKHVAQYQWGYKRFSNQVYQSQLAHLR